MSKKTTAYKIDKDYGYVYIVGTIRIFCYPIDKTVYKTTAGFFVFYFVFY